ncbi:metal ABC transporter permease [Candidatus Neptunochlamydia vexilliferae]|uniref:Metal transport system membrane protein n=1 Tax=Candidatus Neptunichlamydia vexilliferae TaxID=1651774 RepID=A0ABS0B0L4_9BACT|nr:metal ABC transporter permease [Candidatus Neptunochlamydia vexilliferae]MBF5059929.1 putative metal transport system membrane protein [Candidatus Neptunochlamydia vexilliferae]
MNELLAFFTHPFLRMALFAALSSSVAGGIVGSYVVVKRIVFISGSIAHSVLGGLGAALYISRVYNVPWLKPIHGALIAAILAAWLIGTVRLYYRQREDTVIAALWAFGMSIGVIFISLTPGATVEISNYLFGNILWASSSDLYMLLGLDLIVLAAVLLLHRRFLAICFDEKQATLQGLNVKRLYILLLTLVALTIVLMIQVVGAILIVAILSLPAAIANTYTHRLSKMMGLAVLIAGASSFLGIVISYALNWPPGATIALTATTVYLLNLLRKNS